MIFIEIILHFFDGGPWMLKTAYFRRTGELIRAMFHFFVYIHDEM